MHEKPPVLSSCHVIHRPQEVKFVAKPTTRTTLVCLLVPKWKDRILRIQVCYKATRATAAAASNHHHHYHRKLPFDLITPIAPTF